MSDKVVVIKIPEEQYSLIMQSHRNGVERFVDKESMMYAIKNGTLLPKESTNGDMFMTMFPDAEIEGIEGVGRLQCVAVSIGLGTSYFALEWWNSPFKTEKWVNFAEELKDVFEEEVEE